MMETIFEKHVFEVYFGVFGPMSYVLSLMGGVHDMYCSPPLGEGNLASLLRSCHVIHHNIQSVGGAVTVHRTGNWVWGQRSVRTRKPSMAWDNYTLTPFPLQSTCTSHGSCVQISPEV